MRAAIYARNSVDKKDSTTIEDQLRMCRDYARSRGFEIVSEFTDPGISGTAVANRPGFLALMAAAQACAFTEIVVMDMPRFSRNAGDCNKALDKLAWQRVRVHDASKEITSDDDTFRTLIDVDNLMSRLVVKSAAKKSYFNLQGKAERTEAVGSCPYGYRSIVRDDGKRWLDVVPEEAAVVRRIFALFASGISGKGIAHALNDERVPSPAVGWARKTRRAAHWHPAAIVGDPKKSVGIIHNEAYAGRFIWNRSRWIKNPETGRRVRENRPESEWIRRAAPDLRIVDDILWQRVRERVRATQERTLAARRRAADILARGLPARRLARDPARASGRPAPYLLSGLLRCAVCESNFAMADNIKYACASRTNCGPAACSNNQRVRRVDAERILLAELVAELRSGNSLFVAEVERELRNQAALPSPVAALERELGDVSARVERLVAAIGDGLGGIEEVGDALRRAKEDQRQLRARLEALAGPRLPGDISEALREATEEFARVLEDLPEQLSDPAIVYEARETLREWVGDIRIEPTPAGPQAHWRLTEGGLLVAAGPRVARLVAGAGFEPATFGL
jgi:site-specific DNA recombinase